MRTLTHEDVLSTIDYLISLELDIGGASLDDIDHLGNRRLDLWENFFKIK